MWAVMLVIGFIFGFVSRIVDSHMRDCGISLTMRIAMVMVAIASGIFLCAGIISMLGGYGWIG